MPEKTIRALLDEYDILELRDIEMDISVRMGPEIAQEGGVAKLHRDIDAAANATIGQLLGESPLTPKEVIEDDET